MKMLHPKRALLSVSDKTGLLPLARALRAVGCELYASGGTKATLLAEGIDVLSVETLSRSPEAFQGRMKTLSFPIFGGILARRGDASDDLDRTNLGISLIDVVVVNFYPFREAETKDTAALTELIDIGGPALVRAAAKNQDDVLVLSDPSLYSDVIRELKTGRGISPSTREKNAARAWKEVAEYDFAISKVFHGAEILRYGENPHQTAEFAIESDSPIAWDQPLTDSPLSYNNILDFSAGFRLLSDLSNWRPDSAHAVVVKHQNPCGVATDGEGRIERALEMAWACDPVSAFGGIVLLSKPLNTEASEFLSSRFIEGVAAPNLMALPFTRKNLKALNLRDVTFQESETEITVPGGRLRQSADRFQLETLMIKSGTEWGAEARALAQFGILAAKSLKSNAIAIVESPRLGNYRMIGTGQGQPNRIEAIEKLAIPRALAILESESAAARLADAILVSDAFFPFADAVEASARAGIRKIVQPGGSIRDNEVVARAAELGIDLVFTGTRHFRH